MLPTRIDDLSLLSAAGFGCLVGAAMRNLAALNHYYILQRSLKDPIPGGERFPGVAGLWKATEEDMERMTSTLRSLDPESRRELLSRILFYRCGFRNCHVAKSRSGEIAYIQWLIYPKENSVIAKHFRRRFRPLREREVMLENGFTFPRYRGLGILRNATLRLMGTAREEGYDWAIAYIKKERIIPLNEFLGMGFKITRILSEYKLAGFVTRNLDRPSRG